MFRLFSAVAALLSSVSAQDACTSHTASEVDCLGATGKTPTACNWCPKAAATPTCFDWADVTKNGIAAQCGNYTRTDCGDVAASLTQCEKVVGCAWCVSRAVASSCKSWSDASKLPGSIFACTGPY